MRHLGCRWHQSPPGANSVEFTDSSTTPLAASDTDIAISRRSTERTRTVVDRSILPQTRPVARQWKNDNCRSKPNQVRSTLHSNPGASAVLACTWSSFAMARTLYPSASYYDLQIRIPD